MVVRASYKSLSKRAKLNVNQYSSILLFIEHIHKDSMILNSEKQHSTTSNHLFNREKKYTLNFGKHLWYLWLEKKDKA